MGQSQPRCHFPTQAVWYPCCFARPATVSRSGAMSGAPHTPTIPAWSRVRQWYRPVRSVYRVGEQTPDDECASVKRMPPFASESMFGVGILPRSGL